MKLDTGTVKSILDVVTVGMTERAEAHNLVVAEANEEIQKQVEETVVLARAAQAHVSLHVTDSVTAQQEDPLLKTIIEWISNQKVQDLKHLLGDDTNTEEENYPLRAEEADAPPGSSLPLLQTNCQMGRSFVVHDPYG